MKKLTIILFALMSSCASQQLAVEGEPFKVEHVYDQETGQMTIIEHYRLYYESKD